MTSSFLIASPQMKDPNFERTVVLVWHHDENGAIGVVINRPLEHDLSDVLVLAEDTDVTDYSAARVVWGGPVETGTGTVITRGRITEEEGWVVREDLGVTRSHDALLRLIAERAPLLLCLGYAGWGPGQLDREIADGGWLWTDPDPDILFTRPSEERYAAALASLGLNPRSVWRKPIEE